MTNIQSPTAVIDASSSIELEGFEQIEAAPGTALLRVAARSSAGAGARGDLMLVVDDGERRHRLLPLQAPPDPAGLLRAAYSAPLELLQGQAAFGLELPDGSFLKLPPPRRGHRPKVAPRAMSTARATPAPALSRDASRVALREERRLRDEAERRAEARRLAIDELNRRLQAERTHRMAAEEQATRAASAREQALARLVEVEGQHRAARAAQAEVQIQLERESDALAALEGAVTARDAAVAERDAALREAQERLLQAGAALAEERARGVAELEQARAAAARAERQAFEHADGQRLTAEQLAAARNARDAAQARAAEAELLHERDCAELDQLRSDSEDRTQELQTELDNAVRRAEQAEQRTSELDQTGAALAADAGEHLARVAELERQLAANDRHARREQAARQEAERRLERAHDETRLREETIRQGTEQRLEAATRESERRAVLTTGELASQHAAEIEQLRREHQQRMQDAVTKLAEQEARHREQGEALERELARARIAIGKAEAQAQEAERRAERSTAASGSEIERLRADAKQRLQAVQAEATQQRELAAEHASELERLRSETSERLRQAQAEAAERLREEQASREQIASGAELRIVGLQAAAGEANQALAALGVEHEAALARVRELEHGVEQASARGEQLRRELADASEQAQARLAQAEAQAEQRLHAARAQATEQHERAELLQAELSAARELSERALRAQEQAERASAEAERRAQLTAGELIAEHAAERERLRSEAQQRLRRAQAEAAERLRETLASKEQIASDAELRIVELQATAAEANQAVAALGGEHEAALARVRELEHKLEREAARGEDLKRELAHASEQAQARLAQAQAQAEQRLRATRAEATKQRERAQQLQTELGVGRKLGSEHRPASVGERERLAALIADVSSSLAARRDAERAARQLQTELQETVTKLTQTQTRTEKAQHEAAALAAVSRRSQEQEGLADELQRQVETLSAERGSLSDRLQRLVAQVALLAAARTDAERTVADIRAEQRQAQDSHAAAQARVGVLAGEVERAGRELESTRAELQTTRTQLESVRDELGRTRAGHARAGREQELDAVRLRAEKRAREQARAEVLAAGRGAERQAARHAPAKTRAAKPPPFKEPSPGVQSRPQVPRPREAALSQAQARPPAALRPRERGRQGRSRGGWLPSETVVGLLLLALGVTVAILILTGAVKLGFAP